MEHRLDTILKPLTNNDTIYTIALQPDGKLIIGGGRRATQYNYYRVDYRLNLDGTVDSTFRRIPIWGNPDNVPFVQTVNYLDNYLNLGDTVFKLMGFETSEKNDLIFEKVYG